MTPPLDKPKAILLSPAPVDGYPPVQHQAISLACAGFDVELITVPRLPSETEIRFTHDNVLVNMLPHRQGSGIATIKRIADFVACLAAVRRRYDGRRTVEIAYDPLAMFYSDLTPFRPRHRIAHFHEVLDRFETSWSQKRLRKAIGGYAHVVVADGVRARLLGEQLRLNRPPIVVPNYPLAWTDTPPPWSLPKGAPFEVVYAGSIGSDQKIDTIIASLTHWPEAARLLLFGDLRTSWARSIATSATVAGWSKRLTFAGWIDYDKLPDRLARAHLGVSFLDPGILNWRTSAGASNKRYEYMRAGLPQIGDMNPGVPDLIEGNGIGRCVKSFSPKELATLVEGYVRDPARCTEEGRRAYKLHRTKFNYQSAFKPVLDAVLADLGRCDATVIRRQMSAGPDRSTTDLARRNPEGQSFEATATKR